METFIRQGESCLLKVRLHDDTGQPVDLNGADLLDARAQLFVNGVAQDPVFSLNPQAGEEVMESDVSESNFLLIALKREHSAAYPVGQLKAVVLVRTDDPRFPTGYTQEYEAQVGKIVRGLLKDA